MNEEEAFQNMEEDEADQILEMAKAIEGKRMMEGMPDIPMPEEKPGIFQIFKDIISTTDTIKTSNLSKEEINAVRILRNTAIYAKEMNMPLVAMYLIRKCEVICGSALSKEGFSVNALITNKKEFTTRSRHRGEKSGWFKKNVQQQE